MTLYETENNGSGCLKVSVIVLALCSEGVDDRGVEHLTGLVNYSELTAVAVAGIIAEYNLALDGRNEKKVSEVVGEHLECALTSIVKEAGSYFSLDSGEQKSVIRIGKSSHEIGERGRLLVGNNSGYELCNTVILVESYADLEEVFLLATVDSEDSVSFKLLDRLGEIVIVIVNGGLLGSALGGKRAVVYGEGTEQLSDLGIVGNVLCDDVGRALESRLYIRDFLLLLICDNNELLSIYLDSRIVNVSLLHNVLRERLESLCSSYGATGASLGLERSVNILKLYERLCVIEREGDLGSKLFLSLNERGNGCSSLLEVTKVGKSVVKLTKSGIVKTAGNLLTISRNKGDSVTLVDERNSCLNLFLFDAEFLRQCL